MNMYFLYFEPSTVDNVMLHIGRTSVWYNRYISISLPL